VKKQAPDLRASRLDSAKDLAQIRELFAANGFPRTHEELAWIYQPVHGVYPQGSFAESGEETAALYATVPARFVLFNRDAMAAQSLDTMVDERYRGYGLFIRLARSVYERMTSEGVPFVFGFPNRNSFPGFISKLAWQSLDPVPFLFRPMSLGYVVSKFSPRLGRMLRFRLPVLGTARLTSLLEELPPAEQIDSLWIAFSKLVSVARIRDHEFLANRFSNHPRAVYRYRAAYLDGRLVGLAVYCIELKHGGRIGYLMELMCDPAHARYADVLISDTLRDMRDEACDGVLAWCFEHSPYRRALLRKGFLPIPERIRPVELHIGFRPLSVDHCPPELSRRESWYISYSDSDTV
jgi:hypothetical protein